MSPTPDLTACDVLAIGPHPDDVEIGAGGSILLAVAAGRRVAIVDVTRGEMGSRGTAEERAAEAAAAAAKLGVDRRVNLGLPDTRVEVEAVATDLLVAALRKATPRVLLAPLAADVHPDHVAVAQLVDRAFFLAGLVNHRPDLGAPHRPRLLLRYPGNRPVEPTLAVDISSVAAAKDEVIACYRSQLSPSDRRHLVQGLDVRERAVVRDRFFGARIGVAAAEPFVHDGPLPVRDLAAFWG
ncbi:MAG: bacillithiol biosynthesis deacetylase BshB1 [Planctomycetes bacterium]|nr:bacillithiol biosynthesis deacetylase BshB1 [Planctomycetota bacterium]MCB9884440.1 bacillithiol biosynthesis deacetylase BshB1 [Planctomycetota bacterium]